MILKFIHIPKTAGTSIEDWGKQNGYLWGRYDPNCPKCSEINGDGIWHSPAKYWNIDNNIEYFCVIRNPIDRYISAINFLYPNGIGDINIFTHKLLDNNFIRNPNIRAFIPQYEYIYNTDNNIQICNHILKFDNLTNDFTKLMLRFKEYKAYRSLPYSNMTRNKIYSKKDLNKESIDILYKVYARDFEIYDNI